MLHLHQYIYLLFERWVRVNLYQDEELPRPLVRRQRADQANTSHEAQIDGFYIWVPRMSVHRSSSIDQSTVELRQLNDEYDSRTAAVAPQVRSLVARRTSPARRGVRTQVRTYDTISQQTCPHALRDFSEPSHVCCVCQLFPLE